MAYAVTYLQDSECADWTKNFVFHSTKKRTLYYIIFFTVMVLVKRLNYPLALFFLQVNIQYLQECERRNVKEGM